MNATHQAAAKMIRLAARALAGYAASDLLQAQPAAGAEFGVNAFSIWQEWLAARLGELSAAIAARQPQRFTENVRDAVAAWESREISPDHLRLALESLQDVLARELPDAMREAPAEYLQRAFRDGADASARLADTLLPDTPHGRLAATYLLAVLQGDRQRAVQLILDAARQGERVSDLYLQVLAPAQAELGRMWVANEINIAEEHLATATTKMVLSRLRPQAATQPPLDRTLVVAAVAGNQHDLGPQIVADFFEMDGWQVIPLGADMPITDLVQAVEVFRADVLGLSVSLSSQLVALEETIAVVRQSPYGARVKILVGGPALADSGDLPHELGADAYAATAAEAVAVARQLLDLPT
jgi:MerR family transcriptional regulator, light-induced transcriptional regulator